MPSILEEVADLYTTKADNSGRILAKPVNCKKSEAELLLQSDALRGQLPPLNIVTQCPVLAEKGAELAVITGYDRETGIWAGGGTVDEMSMSEARSCLNELLRDFRFASDSDRSRALAALITPALLRGGLLRGRAPMVLCEADQSQTGKGYFLKTMSAVYGEKVNTITQQGRGVGSTEESLATVILGGATILSLDNFRGKLDSPALESILTEDEVNLRQPHAKATPVDVRGLVLAMTSNRAEITTDLANRSSPIQFRKQPEGFRFKTYEDNVDLLEHVRRNKSRYLGAVFCVIRAWYEVDCPRSDEADHSFRDWARAADWIVVNLLGAAPLCDGLKGAKQRMTNPYLNWLREVALAVAKGENEGQWLRVNQVVSIADENGIELPGLGEGASLEEDGVSSKVLRPPAANSRGVSGVLKTECWLLTNSSSSEIQDTME